MTTFFFNNVLSFFMSFFCRKQVQKQVRAKTPLSETEVLRAKGIDLLVTMFTQEERGEILRYINLDYQWPNHTPRQTAEIQRILDELLSKVHLYVRICLRHNLNSSWEFLHYVCEYHLYKDLGWSKEDFFEKYPQARYVK